MAVTKAGKYRAKAVNWGAKTTNAGAPNLAIQFVVVGGENDGDTLYWQGGLDAEVKNTKSQLDITLDALEACGFDIAKHKTLNVVAEGPAGEALDPNREVMLTVEMEAYQGKTSAKVKWVNDLSGGKFKGAIGKDDFASKCQGLGIEAAILKRRQDKGVKAAPQQAAPQVPSLDEIPF